MSGIEQDLRTELDDANRRLGAVAALADDLDREAKMLGGQPERTRSHIAGRLRAVLGPVSGPPSGPGLGPVSGVVEGAGVVRLTADLARVVPCPHDCGWSGPLSRFHYHRGLCPVRADLPAGAVPENDSPVVGHEQEVRAERPESWQAGDQVARTYIGQSGKAVTRVYTMNEGGDWCYPSGAFWKHGVAVNEALQRGEIDGDPLAIWHLAARASGSSAPVQGGAES